MAHQHLGLAEIQRLAGLGELFDTLVVFENYPVDRGSCCGRVAAGCGSADVERARCDALSAEPDGRAGRAAAAAARLSARPVRARQRGGAGGPAGAAAGGGGRRSRSSAIGRLDILAPEERRTILREWNDTARAVPPATLPELFAAQVAAHARMRSRWCSSEHSLSYRELDARANQLAHHLRALGVGPETVVGLCVERSLEMVVGLLGILKAGGAYLPLDPDYPPERLAFMLAGCRRAGAGHAVGAARSAAGARRRASCCLDADAARDRAASRHRAGASRSIRTTPPTSSTPRARPERRKAWPSRMAALPIWLAAQIERFRCRPADRVFCSSRRSSFDAAVWEICSPLLARRRAGADRRRRAHARSDALDELIRRQQRSLHADACRRRCWRR